MTIKQLRSYLRVQCEIANKESKKAELSNGGVYFKGKLTAYEDVLQIANSIVKEEDLLEKAINDSLLHDQDERERI